MEAHEELKSFDVVSVEHDEGFGFADEAKARDVLSSATHTDCSNFILDGGEEIELPVASQELGDGSCT